MSHVPPDHWPFFQRVQLAVVRALLGEVRPELREVAVELTGRHVLVQLVHEGEASEDLVESANLVDTYTLADFPGEGPDAITLETRLVRCDPPGRPDMRGTTVFARWEPLSDEPATSPPPPPPA